MSIHADWFPKDDLLQDRFYEVLWRKDLNGDSCSGIRIPDTIIIRYEAISGWYFTSMQDGSILRKSKSRLHSDEVLEHFNRTRLSECVQSEPDLPIAYALSVQKERDHKYLQIEYFDQAGLVEYIRKGRRRERVVLQMFHEPAILDRSKSNHTIQVFWTPRFVKTEMRVNDRLLYDKHLPLVERCATVEASASVARTVSVRSSTLNSRLNEMCQSIVRHVEKISNSEYDVFRMVVYARVDAHDRLFVLWCSELQIGRRGPGLSIHTTIGPSNLSTIYSAKEELQLEEETRKLVSPVTGKRSTGEKNKRDKRKKKGKGKDKRENENENENENESPEDPTKYTEEEEAKLKRTQDFLDSLPESSTLPVVSRPGTQSRGRSRLGSRARKNTGTDGGRRMTRTVPGSISMPRNPFDKAYDKPRKSDFEEMMNEMEEMSTHLKKDNIGKTIRKIHDLHEYYKGMESRNGKNIPGGIEIRPLDADEQSEEDPVYQQTLELQDYARGLRHLGTFILNPNVGVETPVRYSSYLEHAPPFLSASSSPASMGLPASHGQNHHHRFDAQRQSFGSDDMTPFRGQNRQFPAMVQPRAVSPYQSPVSHSRHVSLARFRGDQKGFPALSSQTHGY
eukprot:ANDGO_00100.mRNA.1 hypothetical protein (macronuclear)